jgi:IS1 family transposase
MPVWTSYSRERGQIVAFVVGTDSYNAVKLFNKTKKVVGKVKKIFTDENSSYSVWYARIGISQKHCAVPCKKETHMIEAVNSSMRDNLARFNRRSKRYSKSLELLECTLILFFHYKKYKCNTK